MSYGFSISYDTYYMKPDHILFCQIILELKYLETILFKSLKNLHEKYFN